MCNLSLQNVLVIWHDAITLNTIWQGTYIWNNTLSLSPWGSLSWIPKSHGHMKTDSVSKNASLHTWKKIMKKRAKKNKIKKSTMTILHHHLICSIGLLMIRSLIKTGRLNDGRMTSNLQLSWVIIDLYWLQCWEYHCGDFIQMISEAPLLHRRTQSHTHDEWGS